jgi:CTP:molybdopterin cytidylyltransferase MocA
MTDPGFAGIFFIYADPEVAALAKTALAIYPPDLPFTMVHNPSPEKGRGESAIIGVRAADTVFGLDGAAAGEDAYYLFLPCDQPLLDAATLRLLLNAARPGCIVEPGDGDCHHSPSVFSASFRDELLSLRPGERPSLLKSRHPQAIITVPVPNPVVLEDIDSPADLERLEQFCG